MTYTNGYPAQSGAASAYSPFNRSAGAPHAPGVYNGYPAAVPAHPSNPYGAAPSLGADTFTSVASHEDIDSLSGNIDSKIAQIRQAFSGGQPAPGPAPMPGAPSAPAVPEADIQWALALEQKVNSQNYSPTPQEVAKYENIAQRLAAGPAAGPAPGQPAAPAVPEADVQWALALEEKVKTQNYDPTPQEVARYENIAQRLSAAAAAPPTQAGAPAAPAVPEADIQWALALEQKVSGQNYNPTAEEVAKYENIAQRLAASQQPAAAPGGAPAGQPRNWADWSQPFSVPSAPSMPLPIAGPQGQAVVNVPTSLRGAPQTPPAAVLNQAPGAPPQMPGQPAPQNLGVSQQEIDWALALEQRVNTQNYQPNAQEMAQYQSIAQRIQAAQQGGQQPPQMPQQAPQMPQQQQFQAPPQQQMQQPQGLPGGLTQQEIDWALALEQRVNTQNYQPNAQELAAYENIAQRLSAGQQQPAPHMQQPSYQQQGVPGMPQSGPQYVMPQPPPQVPILPQNYPQVQPQTPQWVMSPQDQRQQYMPQQPPGMPQPGMPQPGRPQQPGMPPPPGQQAQGPGFMDRLKNAWGALWG